MVKHISNADKQWLDKPGYSKKPLALPEDIGQPGLLVQELKIAPGQVCENHYHKLQTEIFYFTNVNGRFVVNGEVINLEPGDVLIVEPDDWHAVSNHSKHDFRYVVFKFNWEEGDYYEE
ncbi:cupin domain-containing protein [Patescibacteria group bacterium]|nr:cupin domain-containing protein [Patescibacteria group bacterium]